MQTLLNKLAYLGCYIIFILPAPVKNFIGWFIGVLWFDVFRIRRRVAMESISLCFPAWDKKKVERTARASLVNMGMTLVEFADLAFMTPAQLRERVILQGEENFKAAIAQDKGVLILGLHLSNGDVGIAGLSERGYLMSLISKRMVDSPWLDELWFGIRGRFGTRFIEARDSSYDILKALREKANVIFVLDQFMGPPLGVRTTFFGRPTGTAFGLALFAQKTRAPVLPVYAHRTKDGKFVVCFEKPVEFEDQGDKKVNLQYMTQKYTDKLEEIVKSYPDQWMWIHRRWKPFNE